MTALTMSSSTDAVVMALPLRPDDPVSWAFVIKVMLVLVVLLAMTYVVLRWYANKSRVNQDRLGKDDALVCTSVLRLSPKTRVYRVRSGATDVLVTESSHGASMIIVPGNEPTGAVNEPLA